MTFDWDFAWKVGSTLAALIFSLVLYSMRKTFTNAEEHQALDKRVQSLEQTYTPRNSHDDLEKRFVLVQASLKHLEGVPALVMEVSNKATQVEQRIR